MIEGTFNNKPIALYDADKKICFALFDSPTTCGKYVFPEKNSSKACSLVSGYLRGKNCMAAKNNRIGVKLAFRLATEEQINFLINNFAILLVDGYPKIDFNIGLRFSSTRIGMNEEWKKKIAIGINHNKKYSP